MKATIDNKLISRVVSSFPRKGDWASINLFHLGSDEKSISWNKLSLPKGKGGVYAWSFPKKLLCRQMHISLHGPKNSGNVEFHFSHNDLPALVDGRVVLYVGRATDLNKRLKQHLRPSGRTSFQVGKGLFNCGLVPDRSQAKNFMLKHACFHYHFLPGLENAVNRDLIEAALYSKYRAPFNVKSEH